MNSAAGPGLILLLVGAIVLAVAYLARARRPAYTDFHIGRGEWIAPEPTTRYTLLAVSAALGAAGILLLATAEGTGWAFAAAGIALVHVTAMATRIAAVRTPPAVVLRPDGVTVRRPGSTRTVTWESIAADPDALRRAGLRDTTDTRPRSGRLSLDRLDVDPSRVEKVIAYYRDHPDERAAIGTATPRPAPVAA